MIDASNMGTRERRKRVLSTEEQALIMRLCNAELPEGKQYSTVPLPDIYKNNNNLNISLYISQEQNLELPDYQYEKELLDQIMSQFLATTKQLQSLSKKYGK